MTLPYSLQKSLPLTDRLTDTECLLFFRHFSALFSAGIPILKIGELLEENHLNPRLHHVVFHVRQQLALGQSLTTAIKSIDPFDPLIYQLLQIGEHTGKLDFLLKIITQHLEDRLLWKRKIKQILFYPSVILVVAIILTLSILLFVIPKFADLFSELNTTLPLITRCIFSLSAFLQKTCLMIFLLILSVAIFSYIKFPSYQQQLGHIILNLPVIRYYHHLLTITQFTRYLAITLSAGVPILDAITLSTDHLSAERYQKLRFQLYHDIQLGRSLSSTMADSDLFPHYVVQLVKSGEDSGKLTFMLEKSSRILEDDLLSALHRLSQLLEPLIMIVLGVLIGGIMTGMYLPIFKLGSTL